MKKKGASACIGPCSSSPICKQGQAQKPSYLRLGLQTSQNPSSQSTVDVRISSPLTLSLSPVRYRCGDLLYSLAVTETLTLKIRKPYISPSIDREI